MPRAIENPPNPWRSTHVEWLEPPPKATLHVFEERAKRVISKNDSPDLDFKYSVNPYRGCFHGCAYCYARPTHQYWDLGAGTDFERNIIVKVNAPEVLRAELMKPSWKGEPIVFSGNTDCYQPLEASYELTRRCLEVCVDFRQPARLITKSVLIRRDSDLLLELHRLAGVAVTVSIPFADDQDARRIEPYAPSPKKRFAAVEHLASLGIPVGVSLAPMIPGINDMQIPEVLRRAHAAGARHAFVTMLRLAAEVRPVFEQRLREAYPDRAEKVLSQVRQMRGGELRHKGFHDRMVGSGPRWEVVRKLFDRHRERLGFADEPMPGRDLPSRFRRPSKQGELFE